MLRQAEQQNLTSKNDISIKYSIFVPKFLRVKRVKAHLSMRYSQMSKNLCIPKWSCYKQLYQRLAPTSNCLASSTLQAECIFNCLRHFYCFWCLTRDVFCWDSAPSNWNWVASSDTTKVQPFCIQKLAGGLGKKGLSKTKQS